MPFADVLDQPGLYDETRRRAKARRSRRTALVSAVSVAVIALGAGALVQGTGSRKAVPLGSDVTDAQLVAMTGCTPGCEVVDRVELSDGRTFAVVGTFIPTLNPLGGPSQYAARSYLLAHGTDKLDARSVDGSRGAVREARADEHGNVLVPYGSSEDVRLYDVLDVSGSTIKPRPRFEVSSGATGFGERDGDLAVVALPPGTCDTCQGTFYYWSGSEYLFERCSTSAEGVGRRCGDVEVPPLAHPAPQATVTETVDPSPLTDAELLSRARLCNRCVVQARLELGDGRSFAVLGGREQREYVLARGHRVLDELEEIPGHRAEATLLEAPRTDSTGNVILRLGQDGRQWLLPLTLLGDQIALTNGSQGSPPMSTSGTTEFKQVRGELQLVVKRGDIWGFWGWSGSTYVEHPCVHNAPQGYAGPLPGCALTGS